MAKLTEVKSCKIILLGWQGVGKTSLLYRFQNNEFLNHPEPSLSAEQVQKTIKMNDVNVRLSIWDTAGQERFKSLNRLYYRKSDAAIICFDLNKPNENEKPIDFWVSDLKKHVECRIYFCGTKKDLLIPNRISTPKKNEMQALAEEMNAFIIETSSKTGENLELLFKTIAEDFLMDSQNDLQGTTAEICYSTRSLQKKRPNPCRCK